jgi:hypothetical protein
MELDYNEFIYNHKCGECGAMTEVKVKVPKDMISFEYKEPRITDYFCSNRHQVIMPKGHYHYYNGELVLLG